MYLMYYWKMGFWTRRKIAAMNQNTVGKKNSNLEVLLKDKTNKAPGGNMSLKSEKRNLSWADIVRTKT